MHTNGVAPRWGVIGFGEAGSAFAGHLSQRFDGQVFVTDPLLTAEPPPESIRRRLARTVIQIVPTIPDLMAHCDVVLSLVTAKVAGGVAETAAAAGGGALFLDLNSVSPKRKIQSAGYFGDGRYVDGAILGGIATSGARSPIALAGPRAAEAHRHLQAIELNASLLDAAIGSAAALKLCRSIFMKGVECLFVETLLAAEQYGIAAPVLDSIGQSLGSRDVRQVMKSLVTTHAIHCGRRADEMREVGAMLAELGRPGRMTDAAREALDASHRAGVTAHFQGLVPDNPDDVVQYLAARLAPAEAVASR